MSQAYDPSMPSICDVIAYGPLKLVLDSNTGAMVGVLDQATGARAEGLYRPQYIAQAKTYARAFWQSRIDE
jgi:hypothetical protein